MDLKTPFTMVVAGQTGSGKTAFVARLIKEQPFDPPFERILLCYAVDQPIYHDLMNEVPNLRVFEGLPEIEPTDENTLLILDDLMIELGGDKRLASLFTRSRHQRISTIFITQNLYFESKYMRTVTRNAQYLVVFSNPRDTAMIATLGRQAFPDKKNYVTDAFGMATAQPYGYLFMDFKPDTDARLRLRTGIFKNEITRVYLPK